MKNNDKCFEDRLHLKGAFTLAVYACVFFNVMHYRICSKNALQISKLIRTWDVRQLGLNGEEEHLMLQQCDRN